jgi:hypothetical protein
LRGGHSRYEVLRLGGVEGGHVVQGVMRSLVSES